MSGHDDQRSHRGHPVITVPGDWTAEQALVVHEFLERFAEAVWLSYEQRVISLIVTRDEIDANEEERAEQGDLLDDSDIPF